MGLNLMGRGQMKRGIKIFKDLRQNPDDHLFYFIRGMLFKAQKLPKYQTDLNYAYQQSPKNWRYAFSLAEDHFKSGNTSVALKIIQKTFKEDNNNYFAGMLLAQILNHIEDYDKTIELLKNLKILPYEHATEGRKIYTDAYVGSALNYIAKDQNERAKQRLETALIWPEHLGVGKPFDPDERWEKFLLAYIQQNNNLKIESQLALVDVAEFSKSNYFAPLKIIC